MFAIQANVQNQPIDHLEKLLRLSLNRRMLLQKHRAHQKNPSKEGCAQ